MRVEDILKQLSNTPEEGRKELMQLALEATAHMKWVPNPGPQTEAYFSPADEIFFGGQAGGGKDLECNQVVTVPFSTDPSGFKKHGDLVPGDFVYTLTGEQTEVLAVSERMWKEDAYVVEFDTGEKIVAGKTHLWNTLTERDRDRMLRSSDEWRAKRKANRPSRAKEVSKKPGVSANITLRNQQKEYISEPVIATTKTTQELFETLLSRRGALNHSVEVAGTLQGAEVDLPIEPYLFGLWLGDGSSKYPAIHMLEEDWASLDTPEPDRASVATKNRKQAFKTCVYLWMRPELKSLGVWGVKRIPPKYLRASQAQRVSLLQGIMDTDGTCDARGQLECGFSNELLAGDLLELVSSLGVKATIRKKETKSQNGPAKDHYRIKFMCGFPAFRLPRKLARQKLTDFRDTVTRRYITAITPAEPAWTNCIKVADPSGLYLVGRTMIPTHNSDLEIGLAINEHDKSLILRRTNAEVKGLAERISEILGTRDGFNSQDGIWRLPHNGNLLTIGGCQLETDKQKYKGNPRSLICFDEVSDFTESQYVFIKGWNRSANPKQRCRVVAAGNPPTRPEGLWVVRRWAAWLDPKYPNPAAPGELRWYTTGEDGKEIEVDGRGPHIINGEQVFALSRTFIPSELSDNPDLSATNYAAALAGLPEELRLAYRDGDFSVGLRDEPWQAIPSEWVIEAQNRWTKNPPYGVPMCCIGVDVAQGGNDNTVLAARHDGWFARLVVIPGAETKDGPSVAGKVVVHRRDECRVVVDIGGGWGGEAYAHMKMNGIDAVSYMGIKPSTKRTRDRQLGFVNVRAEAYWRFREALDPAQPGGSSIMLPDDPEIVSDLCAPMYEVTSRGVKLESKEEVCKKLSRSPDKGDAIVMAWWDGYKTEQLQGGDWKGVKGGRMTPKVIMGRGAALRSRRR